jgi:hypothetical protein
MTKIKIEIEANSREEAAVYLYREVAALAAGGWCDTAKAGGGGGGPRFEIEIKSVGARDEIRT